MTVIALDNAPENIRGELTRWFLEIKPGVFVGRVNVRIQELLWEKICAAEVAGAVMIASAPNEQGFQMKVSGGPRRRVVDFEGLQLITVSQEEPPGKAEELPAFPLEFLIDDESGPRMPSTSE